MLTSAQKRTIALDLVRSEIEEARAELAEHQRHVDEAGLRVAKFEAALEVLQASATPETKS